MSTATEVDRGDELPTQTAEQIAAAAADAAKTAELAELAKGGAKADESNDADEKVEKTEKDEKDTRIPLARHKAIIEAARLERDVLQAKLEQYERGQDFAATNEALTKAENALLELESRHATELTDGRLAEANKTMAEIRKLEKSISQQQIALATGAAEARAYERARYDTVVDRIEAAYPMLNPDHADYDKIAVGKVMRMAKAFQMEGMPPGQALQEAVKDIMGEPQTKKQENAVEVTPNVSAEDAAKALAANRKEAANKKAAETASKTPPATGKAGKNSDALGGGLAEVDVMKLTQEEFAKLDEQTLSRMRGDTL